MACHRAHYFGFVLLTMQPAVYATTWVSWLGQAGSAVRGEAAGRCVTLQLSLAA
jgi:hypothetical protein